MKILIRDVSLLIIILLCWIIALCYFYINNMEQAFEASLGFPGHLLITLGYYAVCNVCYSILLISDCEKEYDEIQKDLADGKQFFEKKGIKYN